jgi:VWFA-related protein
MINMGLKVAISLGLTAGVCVGQKAPGQSDSTVDLRIPVDLVLVPVTVEDPNGKLIHSLQKNDFEVSEHGIVQNLTYFSVEPSPLSVAVLLDRTIDAHAQDSFKQNMLVLVEAFSDFDEMAFYEFGDSTKKDQDFTFDREKLAKSINQVEFGPVRVEVPTSLSYAPMLFPS